MKCKACNAPMYRVAFDPYTFNTTYECPGCGERFVSDKFEVPKAIKGVAPKKKEVVYIVMCEGAEYDVTVEAVFHNEEQAEERAKALNKLMPSYYHYVINREVE